jgi:hypothetical protein
MKTISNNKVLAWSIIVAAIGITVLHRRFAIPSPETLCLTSRGLRQTIGAHGRCRITLIIANL